MANFLSHPLLPTLEVKTSNGKSQRVTVTLYGDTHFGVRKHLEGGHITEEIHELPEKPVDLPPWENALTIPANAGENHAIIFLLGTKRWLWLLEGRTHLGWKKNEQPLYQEIVLASLSVNPAPHKKLLKEFLIAEDILANPKTNTAGKEPLKAGDWPPLLQLRWLETLLATDVTDSAPEETPEEEQKTQNPSEQKAIIELLNESGGTKELIRSLRKGAVVSMALRSREELPLAKRALVQYSKRQPKNNTWRGLLELTD
jgi:hypothetical protein